MFPAIILNFLIASLMTLVNPIFRSTVLYYFTSDANYFNYFTVSVNEANRTKKARNLTNLTKKAKQ